MINFIKKSCINNISRKHLFSKFNFMKMFKLNNNQNFFLHSGQKTFCDIQNNKKINTEEDIVLDCNHLI